MWIFRNHLVAFARDQIDQVHRLIRAKPQVFELDPRSAQRPPVGIGETSFFPAGVTLEPDSIKQMQSGEFLLTSTAPFASPVQPVILSALERATNECDLTPFSRAHTRSASNFIV